MAKLNVTFSYGQIISEPRIYLNKEKEAVKGTFIIQTVRRYKNEEGRTYNMKKDTPVIMTYNADRIEEIKELRKGDIVEVEGVVTTRPVIKVKKCPFCKENNDIESTTCFVTPLLITKWKSSEDLKENEATELLNRMNEKSNLVYVVGALTVDPHYYKDEESKIEVCQYPLAVNRHYFIKEDDVSVKSDYIWVKTFGEQAKQDYETLTTGATVLVTACLSTRTAENKKNVCEHCGQEFVWKDDIMELNPYSVEYLFNNRDGKVDEDGREKIPSDLGDIDDETGLNGEIVNAGQTLNKLNFNEELDGLEDDEEVKRLLELF